MCWDRGRTSGALLPSWLCSGNPPGEPYDCPPMGHILLCLLPGDFGWRFKTEVQAAAVGKPAQSTGGSKWKAIRGMAQVTWLEEMTRL